MSQLRARCKHIVSPIARWPTAIQAAAKDQQAAADAKKAAAAEAKQSAEAEKAAAEESKQVAEAKKEAAAEAKPTPASKGREPDNQTEAADEKATTGKRKSKKLKSQELAKGTRSAM
ncbi:hypothetical protein MMC07_000426 [Pseudocyphellaria aurata]|nr:hypothetical protein [Pseudocyphellaria aurata]